MTETTENEPLLKAQKKQSKSKGPRLSNRMKKKLLEEYYAEQEQMIEWYKHDTENLLEENREAYAKGSAQDEENRSRTDKILAALTFIINFILLFANLTAAILSGSYSVLSAVVDSAMDITSSIIIYAALWAINNTNMFNYPRGRQRLELLAVIMSSLVMGVANIMMIITSVESILEDSVDPEANLPTIIIMGSGISIKIFLMIICFRQGTPSSKTLGLDQRNDMITNIVAFGGAFIGDHYWKYADPIGAILVCSFIAFSWFSNALDHIPLIAGRRAEREHLSRILTIAMKHDSRIKCLDHIMVYHIGEKELVELHVVLDKELPLKVTHDIAETLELKIRTLEFVERVFVHVDYICDGDTCA